MCLLQACALERCSDFIKRSSTCDKHAASFRGKINLTMAASFTGKDDELEHTVIALLDAEAKDIKVILKAAVCPAKEDVSFKE